jgi:hypothetical protein
MLLRSYHEKGTNSSLSNLMVIIIVLTRTVSLLKLLVPSLQNPSKVNVLMNATAYVLRHTDIYIFVFHEWNDWKTVNGHKMLSTINLKRMSGFKWDPKVSKYVLSRHRYFWTVVSSASSYQS